MLNDSIIKIFPCFKFCAPEVCAVKFVGHRGRATRVLRNTPHYWRPSFPRHAPHVGHSSFLASDSETYTRCGISGIHFLAYYCILTVHPLDPRAALRDCVCASESRIKIGVQRTCMRTRVLRAYIYIYVCVCVCVCVCTHMRVCACTFYTRW